MLAGHRRLADGVPSLDNEGHTADGSLKKMVRKAVARIGGNTLIVRDWPIEWCLKNVETHVTLVITLI